MKGEAVMEVETKNKIKRILEALLFVTSRPLTIKELRDVVSDVDVIPEKQLLPLLEELTLEYDEQERSFKLEETADGFQIRTRSEYAPWLSKLYKDRRSEKLSHAVLETLAIIAYRQPITKSEIEGVRGVDVTGPLKKCLDFDFVSVVGKKEILGRPFMYGTTLKFLKQFGLKTIDELPRIEELRELGTGQKELELEEKETPSKETEEQKETDSLEEEKSDLEKAIDDDEHKELLEEDEVVEEVAEEVSGEEDEIEDEVAETEEIDEDVIEDEETNEDVNETIGENKEEHS